MPFQSIQMAGPETAKLRQPVIYLTEWLRFQPVETALCVHGGFHKASVPQYAQVFGHCRLRHAKLALDLSHRLF